MFYDFPYINKIHDVLSYIKDRKEFLVMDKGDYLTINYAVAFEETFQWDSDDPVGSAIRRECRGLIFDKEGNLISRPYSKFFNIGEKEETQLNKINLYEPHVVLEKLDGSMIRPIPTKDGFRLATKAGVTEISQQAEEFIEDKPHYSTFIKKCIQKGITPLFEWCSNKNRIVVSYPEDQLILTGMRHNTTGEYVDYETMKTYATAWSIPVVQAVDGLAIQDINLFVKQVREWDDGEGVVIRFSSGHMCKVKSADYVLRHKTKEQINQEKNVIQIILNDSVDDFVPLLNPCDATRLKTFQRSFWEAVNNLSNEMESLYIAGNTMYPDRKDFAVNFVQKMILPIHVHIMYAMRGGNNSRDIIIDMISKSLVSQTKVDQNRWLWGHLNWNHF